MSIRYDSDLDPDRPLPMRNRILIGIGMTVAATMLIPILEDRLDEDRTFQPTAPADAAELPARPAKSPGCLEDEAAVVRPALPGEDGLAWVCVPLDDFTTEEAVARALRR